MVATTRENSVKTRSVDMESTIGLMVNFMRGIGRKIKCMDKEHFYGRMENAMKVNLLMINVRVRAISLGQMGDNTLASGSKGNSMEKVATYQKRGQREQVNGIMEEKCNGLTNEKIRIKIQYKSEIYGSNDSFRCRDN